MNVKWLTKNHAVCSIPLPIEESFDVKQKERWIGIQGGDAHYDAFVSATSHLSARFDGRLFKEFIASNDRHYEHFFLVKTDKGIFGALELDSYAILLAPVVDRDLHGLTIEHWETLCIRCGECCHLVDYTKEPPEVQSGYCPHLHFEGGEASCDVYPKKYGTKLPDGGFCSPIENCTWRGPNCGYNQYLPKPRGIPNVRKTGISPKNGTPKDVKQ